MKIDKFDNFIDYLVYADVRQMVLLKLNILISDTLNSTHST